MHTVCKGHKNNKNNEIIKRRKQRKCNDIQVMFIVINLQKIILHTFES